MNIVDTITADEAGTTRVVIVTDTDAHAPDGDFFGSVYRLEGSSVDTMGQRYRATEDHADEIRDAWGHFGDLELVGRYLKMFHDIVGFDWIDLGGRTFINVVTPADLETWGYADLETYRRDTGRACATYGNLVEWEAWAEGEVYGYMVQRVVTWTPDTDQLEPRDEWEDTDDACFGFYGYDYAEEMAREALAAA